MERRCTECGGPLPEGSKPNRLTCSGTCRAARHRRQARGRAIKAGGSRPGRPDAYEVLDAFDQEEIAKRLFEQELEPYVREAITDDVIKALGGLMKLTPAMVEATANLLVDPDPSIRLRAAQLIAKYTMADSLMPAAPPQPLRVDLTGIPSPQPEVEGSVEPDHGATVSELRECSDCHVAKPESEFDVGAPRCNQCQDELKRKVLSEWTPQSES